MSAATIDRLAQQLWSVHDDHLRPWLAATAEIDRARLAGLQPAADRSDPLPVRRVHSAGHLDLRGVMLHRPPAWMAAYGVEHVDTLLAAERIAALAADAEIDQIHLHWDSPGGHAMGSDLLGQAIAAAVAGGTRVVSHVDGLLASAAYEAASQSSSIVVDVGDMAIIGSLGSYIIAYDTSGLYADAGIRTHRVHSGGIKGEPDPGAALSREYLDQLQRSVDQSAALLIDMVAAGRGLPRATVVDLADGRWWHSRDAVALGLVDVIGQTVSLHPENTEKPKENPMTVTHAQLAALIEAHADHAITIAQHAAAGRSAAEIETAIANATSQAALAALTTRADQAEAALAAAQAELSAAKTATAEATARAEKAEADLAAAKLLAVEAGTPKDPGTGDGDPDAGFPANRAAFTEAQKATYIAKHGIKAYRALPW